MAGSTPSVLGFRLGWALGWVSTPASAGDGTTGMPTGTTTTSSTTTTLIFPTVRLSSITGMGTSTGTATSIMVRDFMAALAGAPISMARQHHISSPAPIQRHSAALTMEEWPGASRLVDSPASEVAELEAEGSTEAAGSMEAAEAMAAEVTGNGIDDHANNR